MLKPMRTDPMFEWAFRGPYSSVPLSSLAGLVFGNYDFLINRGRRAGVFSLYLRYSG